MQTTIRRDALREVKKITVPAAREEKSALRSALSWRFGREMRVQTRTAGAHLAGKETVLLITSAPMMRGLLARILRQLGYRVVEAAGAVEAQKLAASRGEIHLLFMDLSGSDPDDLQLALWFHGMYPQTKILVASVSLWDFNCHFADLHDVTFLAKPYTSLELARIIRRIFDQENLSQRAG